MLTDALTYVEGGLAVLPLRGKSPVGRLAHHGSKSATMSRETALRWWDDGDHNIGVRVPAGHLVLDVDPRNGGDTSLEALIRTYAPLPPTRCALTGGGGWHYWFRHGRAAAMSSRGFHGLDLKAPGSYVVAPPSIHPDTGRAYAWVDASAAVAPLPPWLAALLTPTPEPRPAPASVTLPVANDRPRHVGLSEDAWNLLQGRSLKIRGDTTKSGVFWTCLWYLANAGWTHDEVMALARSKDYPALHDKLLERGASHVRQQYSRVLELSRRMSPVEEERLVRMELALEVAAEKGAWSGKGGVTEQLLMRQFLNLARRVGRTRLHYSFGQIVDDGAWRRRPTVIDALRRLQDAGWLRVVEEQDGKYGKAYQLCVPRALRADVKRLQANGPQMRLSKRTSAELAPLAHDAFAGTLSDGTHNRTTALVLQALLENTLYNLNDGAEELEKKGSVSTTRLAQVTSLSRTTLLRHLRDLANNGLVRQVRPGSWVASDRLDLDSVADRQGTVGTAAGVRRMVEQMRADQTARLQERSREAGRGA